MRIRKNTKLSSMLLATTGYAGERPETYVCLLNQSPWDVIPVTSSGDDNELTNLLDSYWFLPPPPLPKSSSSSPPLPIQYKFNGEEDKFKGINVSLGDSNGVTERLENLVTVKRSPEVKEQMKSKPVELNSPVKTSGGNDNEDQKVVPGVVSMPAPPKRGRPRGTGKKTPAPVPTANPYEFYYYSGFSPRWGRKRGGGENINTNIVTKKSSCSSDENGGSDKTTAFENGSSSFDEFEYVEDDFDNNVVDQEEEDSDHGKMKKKKMMKKMVVRKRKPVKERSLKSLM